MESKVVQYLSCLLARDVCVYTWLPKGVKGHFKIIILSLRLDERKC